MAGTAVCIFAPLPGLWIMVGPAIVAATIVATGLLNTRGGTRDAKFLAALLIPSVALLIASLILAVNDPAQVGTMLPLLAGGPAFLGVSQRWGPSSSACQDTEAATL
jgi:hypothetical protein